MVFFLKLNVVDFSLDKLILLDEIQFFFINSGNGLDKSDLFMDISLLIKDFIIYKIINNDDILLLNKKYTTYNSARIYN